MPERAARSAALVLGALGVLVLIGAGWNARVQPDTDAYWLAAHRLREGLPLYVSLANDTEIYRYAPWFALAWVPLTYLPQDVAYLIWRSILVVATVGAVAPLVRRATPAAVVISIIFGGVLLSSIVAGNVTPLLVGALVVGVRGRGGPIVVGLAASLKVFPILFVAGYLAERRWVDAGLAIVTAGLLWAGILAFDPATFTRIGGAEFYVGGVSLFSVSALLWFPVAVVALMGVTRFMLQRSGWTWLAAAAAIPVAVPRVWLPDVAYVLVGIVHAPPMARNSSRPWPPQ